MIRPAAVSAIRGLRDRRFSIGLGGGDGYASVSTAGRGGDVTRSTTAVSAIGTVDVDRGAMTMVVPIAGSGSSADASASTKAVADSHRAAGSLASPRMTTASAGRPSDLSRELGEGGSRWTCA